VYGAGRYDLALLGDPSVVGTWMLHFGGDHLAVNVAYEDGEVAGSSPYFLGAEPASFDSAGTTLAPMRDLAAAVKAVTRSLSDEQLGDAQLTSTHADVLLGPGDDGRFPEPQEGLVVGSLPDPQRQLVLAAIRPWVGIADDATAGHLMAAYAAELDRTYVGWSGGTGLTTPGDYFRIHGPSVWIELVCQEDHVVPGRVHYHSVYRDRTRDYGGPYPS
jgi:hypothetical protein